MKLILKIIAWLLGIIVVAGIGLFAFVQFTWDKDFDAPYPAITASKDSAVLARGEYLVYGPMHCSHCHVSMDKLDRIEAGEKLPLSGGFGLEMGPMGTYWAPNITPDEETGIGKYTDGEIARALRHGVKRSGKMMFPFMPFQNMSDEDLTAVISFLRSQEPVKNQMQASTAGPVTKALLAFGMFKPEGPKGTPPKSVAQEATAEYGKYVAVSLSNCMSCHTSFDEMSGQFNGPEFAGGFYFKPDAFSKGYSFISPNLTPHEGTGIMTFWSEDEFVERFKRGRVHAGSPMPWGAFKNIDETDLRAVYKFLRTLPPSDNKIDKIVFEPGEKPEKKKS